MRRCLTLAALAAIAGQGAVASTSASATAPKVQAGLQLPDPSIGRIHAEVGPVGRIRGRLILTVPLKLTGISPDAKIDTHTARNAAGVGVIVQATGRCPTLTGGLGERDYESSPREIARSGEASPTLPVWTRRSRFSYAVQLRFTLAETRAILSTQRALRQCGVTRGVVAHVVAAQALVVAGTRRLRLVARQNQIMPIASFSAPPQRWVTPDQTRCGGAPVGAGAHRGCTLVDPVPGPAGTRVHIAFNQGPCNRLRKPTSAVLRDRDGTERVMTPGLVQFPDGTHRTAYSATGGGGPYRALIRC
jgi:hypothetical protein